MSNGKWFYPIQDKVKVYLAKTYATAELQFQDVCKNRVYEYYMIGDAEGIATQAVLIIMYKHMDGFLTYISDERPIDKP